MEDELPSIQETIQKRDKAPDSGMFVIWDKESYQEDLNDYLDDALSILLPDSYLSERENLQEIDTSLDRLNAEKSKLETEQKLDALRPSDRPGLVGRMLNWIDKDPGEQMRDLLAQIDEQERTRDELFERFRKLLKKEFGQTLELSEVKALLYQINGAELVEGVVVAKVLVRVEEHIRNSIERETPPEVLLQYYGYAFVVRLIVERLHARHLENYDSVYLSGLDELEGRRQETLRDSEGILAKMTGDENRAAVENNIRLLRKTGRAMALYREWLKEHRGTTGDLLRQAHEDVQAARNTFDTLKLLGDVTDITSKALAEFARMSEITTPELLPLDNLELSEQLIEISKKLSSKQKG